MFGTFVAKHGRNEKNFPKNAAINHFLRLHVRGGETLALGRETVDLRSLVLLADDGQARAAGDAILYAVEKGFIDGNATIAAILDRVFADIEASGLRALVPAQGRPGDYAMPRRHEVAGILNRLKSLQVRTQRAAPGTPEGPVSPEGPALPIEAPAPAEPAVPAEPAAPEPTKAGEPGDAPTPEPIAP